MARRRRTRSMKRSGGAKISTHMNTPFHVKSISAKGRRKY